MLSRRVKIVESEIAGPYNILDLAEGESVEVEVAGYAVGRSVREITDAFGIRRIEAPIMRIHLPPGKTVLGAPYLDILAGRTIATVKAFVDHFKTPLKLKFTAHGKEPAKWYEVEVVK